MKKKLSLLLMLFCGTISISVYAAGDTVHYVQDCGVPVEEPEMAAGSSEFTITDLEVRSVRYKQGDPRSQIVMPDDTIIVTVNNVEIIEKKRTLNNPIILFLNGIPFESINGHLAGAKRNQVKFVLNRNYSDNDDWDKVLRTGFVCKGLYLNVGLQDQSLITSVAYPIKFTLRTPAETIPFIILCILLGAFTLFVVWKKKMLRNNIQGYYIYSLSHVHLFFWTQIITLSYILIWFVCDDMNSIESSSLVLLGISAGTASIATAINGSAETKKITKPGPSRGFFNDILSENNEFSIHRYQIFLFNSVIGAFFIYKTIDQLKMPVLNDAVLALLGISSATYTAIKAIASKNIFMFNPQANNPPASENKEAPPATE